MKQILHSFTLRVAMLTTLLVGGFTNGAWADEYELYSGDITEGDYLIVYEGGAMKAAISSNRLQYTAVTATDNKISDPDKDLIWTIREDETVSGTYNLYNAYTKKYAGSTGTKNQAALNDACNDQFWRWTISGTSTYEFVNKQNSSNKVNAYLRRNGTYGFACYSTTTGGALSLYKKVESSTPSYTISAASNNNSYGSVSLSGSVITATPEVGYRYADPAYTITQGTATVSQDGNNFTVTPSSDCTVTINFEAIPTHTATFSVNGTTTSDAFAEGASITFPSDPSDINGKTFVGWMADAIIGTTDVVPSFVTSATMSSSDITYYAVFATADGSGEDSWTETALSSITSSDIFVISDGTYAMNNDGGTSDAPSANSITDSNGKITSTVSDNLKWNVSGNATDGYVFYPNGSTTSWLYCNTTAPSGSNNNIRVGAGDRKLWIFDNSGYLKTNDNSTPRYLSLYNSQDFRGYTSTANGAFQPKFYKYAAGITYSAYCTTVSALPVPTITFTDVDEKEITELNVTALDVTVIGVVCSAGEVTLSVESSDENVAEYDNGSLFSYTGGTATLTATFAGNESYQGTSATLTVNVAKAPTTTAVEAEVENTDVYTATEGGLAVATVKDESGNAIVGTTVTWTSSNTSVATIDAAGSITLKAAGETTITASYAGDAVYAASEGTYVLTLTNSKPQETSVEVTINNTFFECDAFTSYSSGSPTSYTGTIDNVDITYAKGTGSGFYCNASGVRIYTGGSLTFSAPEGYVITKIELVGEDGFESGLTTPEASTTWTGSSDYVEIAGETKSGNSRKNLTGATVTLAETVTVGTAGYTTYVTKQKSSFENVTAYIATQVNAETLSLTKVTSAPVGTPVIIEAEAGTYTLPVVTTTEDVTANILQASDGTVTGDGSSIFALGIGKSGDNQGKVGFYLVTEDVEIPAGKAYLEVAAADPVKGFTLDFANATAICSTPASSATVRGSIYNLSGQRLSEVQRGVNIINGKKVIVQ